MRIRDRISLGLTRYVGPTALRIVYARLTFRITGDEWLDSTWRNGQPVVFASWHGRLLPLFLLYRENNVVILVSSHRDGEYLARLGKGLGYDSIRGSSTRGGSTALREMIKAVQAGRSVAITPDGPTGPREKVKPGALQVARMTGAPLIPITAGTKQAWWFEGWDRFLIPKPFAHVRVAIGEPMLIEREVTDSELEKRALELERTLTRLKSLVDE